MWHLTDEDLERFRTEGFLVVPDLLDAGELEVLASRLPAALGEDASARVLEDDGRSIRAVHGTHRTDEVFARLVALPRLLDAAQAILESPVYVHQFKINAKLAFHGDTWKWHQDYVFWEQQDGIRSPRLVNLAIFLDAVTEFNGPLYLIPGSHAEPGITPRARDDGGDWTASFSADLKYVLSDDDVRTLVDRHGIVAPKGGPGTGLLFHPQLAHASPPNISPHDRRMALITYNSVANPPEAVSEPRPETIASRDVAAVTPLPADTLLPV